MYNHAKQKPQKSLQQKDETRRKTPWNNNSKTVCLILYILYITILQTKEELLILQQLLEMDQREDYLINDKTTEWKKADR